MNQFERDIGKTFATLEGQGIVKLFFLNPPMRIAGNRKGAPLFVQAGKAPYDICGYTIPSFASRMYPGAGGEFVAIELKSTKDPEDRLPIVQRDRRGNGLQQHQLEALVAVHKAGGIAMVVWNNAGTIGVIQGNVLDLALVNYRTSLAAKNPKRGSRSIPWATALIRKLGTPEIPLWFNKGQDTR